MQRRFPWLAVVPLVAMLCGHSGRADQHTWISVPAESLVSVHDLSGISIETSWRHVGRQLDGCEDDLSDLDGWGAHFGVAYSPWPFVRAGGFVGSSTLNLDSPDAEYGAAWGVNATVAFVEFVLESSPVYGSKKAFRLLADLEYRQSDLFGAEGEEGTLEEVTVAPHVVYAVNLRGADRWHPHGLLGTALRGGVVFSSLDGDIDEDTYDEAGSYGVLLGVDMQFGSEVTLRLSSHIFGEDDITSSAHLGYYF